jgi:hypothetical protein
MTIAANKYHCNSNQAFELVSSRYLTTAFPEPIMTASNTNQEAAPPMLSLTASTTLQNLKQYEIRPDKILPEKGHLFIDSSWPPQKPDCAVPTLAARTGYRVTRSAAPHQVASKTHHFFATTASTQAHGRGTLRLISHDRSAV